MHELYSAVTIRNVLGPNLNIPVHSADLRYSYIP